MFMPNFKKFTDDLLSISFDCGDVDAADIQDIALHHGVLKEVVAHEPCGDDCRCADGEFPVICMRKAY